MSQVILVNSSPASQPSDCRGGTHFLSQPSVKLQVLKPDATNGDRLSMAACCRGGLYPPVKPSHSPACSGKNTPDCFENLQQWLASLGYKVVPAARIVSLPLLERETIVLVLSKDGVRPDVLSAIRTYRERGGCLPMLLLVGQENLQELADALDVGADDYIALTRGPYEVAARIRALLTRSVWFYRRYLHLGALEIDTLSHEMRHGKASIKILPRELALFEFFVCNPNRVLTPRDLIRRLWPNDTDVSERVITLYVARIRKKMAALGLSCPIRTLTRVGYVFESQPERSGFTQRETPRAAGKGITEPCHVLGTSWSV